MRELNLKNLSSGIAQIAEQKMIPKEKVIEVIESSLAAAYKKEYGKKSEKYRMRFDKDTGNPQFFKILKAIDENMVFKEGETQREGKIKFNPLSHIMINEAKEKFPDKEIKAGEEIEILLPSKKDFGRIAVGVAKQTLLQKTREAEKEVIFSEFAKKENEILSGIIQRKEKDTIFVDLGKTIGILLMEDQTPGEFYKLGTRLRFYCLRVEKSPRGVTIYLSRNHPKFLSKLFELEVPEIANGAVEIKAIAREPGIRAKIAVLSKEKNVDPIGSLVGQRGTRVNAVIQELGREKIDIILWSEEPEEFIKNALSPAKVIEVKIRKNVAEVKVPRDQLSLAIGKNGQNIQLASELCGWKINIISEE